MTPQEQIAITHGAIDPDCDRGVYTYMSDEAIEATITANPSEHYRMELNPEDFARLLWTLRVAYDANAHEAELIGEGSDIFPDDDGSISDWVGGLANGIAQTLGIEWV